MSCNGKNILVNPTFRNTLEPWQGRNITYRNNRVIINNGGILFQNVQGTFNPTCAFYLFFIIANPNSSSGTKLFAVVTYLNQQGLPLRITSLLVQPPFGQSSFFAIVPPAPAGTVSINVLFQVEGTPIKVDNVFLRPKDVGFTPLTKPVLYHISPEGKVSKVSNFKPYIKEFLT